jgi:hypothetical protein
MKSALGINDRSKPLPLVSSARNRLPLNRLRLTFTISILLPLLVLEAGCQSKARRSEAGEASRSTSSTADPNGPTEIAIGTKVLRQNVKRFGINLSGQTFYDSGQMMRNLTFRNPGFEGEIWETVLQCKFVQGNSCADDDEWSSWPTDFAKGGSFEFFYGNAKGETGTIAGNTVANTTPHRGVWMNFGNLGVLPKVGDFYIVRLRIPGGADQGWRTDIKNGATLTTEFKDLSRSSPGKQALRLAAAGPGQFVSITSDVDTWANKSFVQLTGAYTLSFRAKGVGGNNTLNVSISRLTSNHGNVGYFNRQIPLTSSWQDFEFPLQFHEDGTFQGPMPVTFGLMGGSALLDDVAFTEVPAKDNPTAYRNAVVRRLRELRPGILRYMDNGTSFGSTIDNLIAPPFARMRAGYSEGPHEQADIPIGLHEFLVLCQTVHAEPWFVLPMGITPAEMQNLIAYFAAPASSPYGAKRAALGQSQPWTQVFSNIHLELGNETWNWNSFPGEGILDPKAYGSRVSQIFAFAKTAPGYDAQKFDMVMDGWWAVPSWTEDELNQNPHADTIDIAPYTFNPLSDTSSTEAIFGPMFAEPERMNSRPNGLVTQNARLAAKYGVKLAVYEVNLGTSFGKASQADLESTIPSLGAGLTVADHMLMMLRDDGPIHQALFALPEYANGFNNSDHPEAHELVKLWGAVVDMGGETDRVRPSFLAEELANEALTGNMVEAIQSGSNPTWDQPKSLNGEVELKGAHLIQSFAFTDGQHHNVVLFNLSRSKALPVTFSGPNAPHGSVQVSRLTSAHLTDSNETAHNVSIRRESLSVFNPAAPYSLPPYSMTLISW